MDSLKHKAEGIVLDLSELVSVGVADGELLVTLGTLWFAAGKEAIAVGFAGGKEHCYQFEMYRKRCLRLAALIGLRRNSRRGDALCVELPGIGGLRALRYGYRRGNKKKDRVYGVIYSPRAEGLYWGTKRAEYGDPQSHDVLWSFKCDGWL